MKPEPASSPVYDKLLLLCEHVENLCAQSVKLMEAGEAAALATLQERKAVILIELRQLVERVSFAAEPGWQNRIAQRVQAALSGELRGVNAQLLELKQKLHENAAAELRLAKIRRGYGAHAPSESQAYGGFISTCG